MNAAAASPAPALVAQLLNALREQSDALKCGNPARAALADGRRRCLLRLLMTGAPGTGHGGPTNA